MGRVVEKVPGTGERAGEDVWWISSEKVEIVEI